MVSDLSNRDTLRREGRKERNGAGEEDIGRKQS